jgi:hypothetical protein
MKYFFLIFLFIGAIGCTSTSDYELIEGNWKFIRFQQGKKILLSADPVEERKIIDKHIAELYDNIKDVRKFRDNAEKEMDSRLSVFMQFNADSTLINTDISTGVPDVQQWKYELDPENHQLTIDASGTMRVYTYKIEADKLVLTEKDMTITFQRQKEEQ